MKKNNMILLAIGVLAATAAAFFLVKKNQGYRADTPPKKAPQVRISNPGEQSEFITSASESEVG